MKKPIFLAILVLIFAGCAGVASDIKQGNPVTREAVLQMAGKYGLLNADGYAPQFKEEDILFWVEKGVRSPELGKEFALRRTVLRLAREAGYPIKSHGDLSYFAEQLGEYNMTKGMVKKSLWDKKQLEAEARLQPKGLTAHEIKELARESGLTKAEGFVPDFTDGDASYWESLNLDERTLKKEFWFRAKIFELARQAGYIIPTQGDLSYFAERLRDEQATEKEILEELARKSSPFGPKPHYEVGEEVR